MDDRSAAKPPSNAPVRRILAIDPGERRLGVAVSDPLGLTAQGVEVVHRKKAGFEQVLRRLGELADHYDVGRIIVGLPLNMDGSRGPRARRAEAFAKELGQRVSVPVDLVDERLTTVEAEDSLRERGLSAAKRKERVDVVAAQLLLQRVLDAGGQAPRRPATDP